MSHDEFMPISLVKSKVMYPKNTQDRLHGPIL